MIQPREEIPGEYGHPAWKRNVFAAIVVCVVGVLMIATVGLMIWGIGVLAIGIAWAVIAFLVGRRQEGPDLTQGHAPRG